MQFGDEKVAAVFAEYEERLSAEHERMRALAPGTLGQHRDEFLLPLGEEAAGFLHALALARKPGRILELGTSYGYSTLFFADAARQCGAQVVSVDLDASKQAYAREMLEKAGLADFVEFRCGDAIAIAKADPGPFELVLLDIWKDVYVPCFEAVYPKLSDEGIVASDNMIYPEGVRDSARALREAIHAKPDLQTALLPVGQGIELTVKWSAGNEKL
jgi:predicted O-methyltransferase YrrM